MNNLVAYSDDEDDELVNAGMAKVTTKASSDAPQTNGTNDGIEKNVPSLEDKGRSEPPSALLEKPSLASEQPRDETLHHLLPPPPRISTSSSIDPSDGSTASTSSATVDPYWRLSSNEKVMTDTEDPLYRKLANFHKLKEEQGTHFNQSLHRNRSFRNPHIYSKLVQWVEVEETGSAYSDMIKDTQGDKKSGTNNADSIWSSSQEARAALKSQGGKDVIAALQRKRQEEADERKKRARRENIDFVGATSSPSRPATTTATTKGGGPETNGGHREREKYQRIEREKERERDRARDRDRDRHKHRHHRERY